MIVTMIIIVVVVIIASIRILWDVYSPLSDPEAFAAALIDDVSHVISTTNNNDRCNNNSNNRDESKSLQSLKKKVAKQIRDQCYQIWTQGHLNNNDVSPNTNNNAINNNSNSNSNSNKRPKTANVRYAYGVRKHKKEVQDFTPEFTTSHNINYHQNDEDPLQRS